MAPSCCCVFFHSATICVGLRSSSLLSVLLAAVSRKSLHALSFTGGTGADTFTSVISTPRASSSAPVWNPPFSESDTLSRVLWSSVLLEFSTPASGLESGSLPEETCCNSDSQTVDGLCYRIVTARLLVDYATEQWQPDCWWTMLQNSDSQTVDGLCYRIVTGRLLMDYATE